MRAAEQPLPAEPSRTDLPGSRLPGSIHALNLRGVPCPLNLVKAKLALERIAVGDILEIELDDGEPIRNVPVSLGRQGQEILETTQQQGYFCLKVRKRL